MDGAWVRAALSRHKRKQVELARYMGWPPSAVSRILSGERQIKTAEATRIYAFFGEPNTYGGSETSLYGYVGAGQEIVTPDDDHELERVPLPTGTPANVLAVRVRGDSMFPFYQDGDIIYFAKPDNFSAEQVIGRDCVCRTEDGRSFLKKLERGSAPDTWTLVSYNSEPIRDVRLLWASRVLWVKKTL